MPQKVDELALMKVERQRAIVAELVENDAPHEKLKPEIDKLRTLVDAYALIAQVEENTRRLDKHERAIGALLIEENERKRKKANTPTQWGERF